MVTRLGLFGLIVVAGLSLDRVYSGSLLTALVVGAAAGSVLVCAMLRRAPGWLVAPVSVVLLLGYGLGTVWLSAKTAGLDGGLGGLAIDAARNAVPRLLTALIPIEPQPDTVLAPVVLAWLAGLLSSELVGRAGLALVPPTLLYGGSLVLVGPNASIEVWQPLLFAVLAAAVLAASRPATPMPPALRLRAATGVGAGLVAVLAVIAVAAPLVSGAVGSRPGDPRAYVEPPDFDVQDENPLIRIAGWAANPDQRLFDVAVVRGLRPAEPAVSATPSVTASNVVSVEQDDVPATVVDAAPGVVHDTRLRLAVLPEWDGVTWHMSGEYRGAGRVLPPVEGSPAAAEIEERITINDLAGHLLPAVSVPQRIDGLRVAYDQGSGTLLSTAELAPGVSYAVASSSPSLEVNLLPVAEVPSGPEVAPLLAVGDSVPNDLLTLAQKIVASESSPYQRANAIAAFLSEHYRFAADAPSGHAYPNLRFFLFTAPYAGGGRGTSEQFAASFAALGRLVGLPTRVVVGFQTPAGGGAVTAGDALAWPEVLFKDIGWVAFDPMPDPAVPPRPLEDEFLPKPPPATAPPTSEPPETPARSSAPPPSSSAAAAPTRGIAIGPVAGGVGAGVLVVLVIFLAVVVLLRELRRRGRLHRGTPPERVVGAWHEVLDALRLAGSPPPRYLAAAEIAAHAATVVADTPGRRHARKPRPAAPTLDDLAASVNAVGFAPVALGGADDAGATRAAEQAQEFSRALRARRPWWHRLLWTVDPRPLRRPRGKS
jgi:transglutaminase-like putative cysteine protease